MKQWGVLAAVVLSFFVVQNGALAGSGMVGKTEFAISASSFSCNEYYDEESLLLGASISRFFTPNLQLRLGYTYVRTDSDQYYNSDRTRGTFESGIVYNMISPESARIVPYFGLSWIFLNGNDKPDLYYGARLFIGGNYNTASNALFVEFDRSDSIGYNGYNSHNMRFGLSTFF